MEKLQIIHLLRDREYKKMLEDLNQYIENLINDNERLRERLRDFNKDVEIQKLTNEISMLRETSLHFMTEKEKEEAELFSEEHYNSCKSKLGIAYILVGTGIGTAISVECQKCKVRKSITDFSNW